MGIGHDRGIVCTVEVLLQTCIVQRPLQQIDDAQGLCPLAEVGCVELWPLHLQDGEQIPPLLIGNPVA